MSWHSKHCCRPLCVPELCQLASLVFPCALVEQPQNKRMGSSRKRLPRAASRSTLRITQRQTRNYGSYFVSGVCDYIARSRRKICHIGKNYFPSMARGEAATALWALTDKSDHHLACHANSAARRKRKGSALALCLANSLTIWMHVGLHLPPTSHANVMSWTLSDVFSHFNKKSL